MNFRIYKNEHDEIRTKCNGTKRNRNISYDESYKKINLINIRFVFITKVLVIIESLYCKLIKKKLNNYKNF